MKRLTYSYCVIKYVHDPAAGEMLNIGVVVWFPAISQLFYKLEMRYERLSKTFVNFDGENFKRTLRHFEIAVETLQQELSGNLFSAENAVADVKTLIKRVWPDEDLSFQAGSSLVGITDDPEQAVQDIYHRFVASQWSQQSNERRNDEQIWSLYSEPLSKVSVSKKLVTKDIITEEFSLKFNHAFKNDKWHLLEPISLDYVKASTIQGRATNWLGNATAMQGHPELGKLYLLLGQPRLSEHRKSYEKAKNLLHKMPIPHEIIEENEAEDFAQEMANFMKEHGV
ncbi:MAG: DUF3037 domain-containing protein [Blastocatellia bacterium]|nr:DUF3037 domain-containing protein [Blastocatellia bacterium]